MEVSVVIPTYNRAALLERCIEALLDQDLNGSRYEIIVVDDAASAETEKQLKELSARVSQLSQGPMYINYASTSGRCGPATARNIGWRHAHEKSSLLQMMTLFRPGTGCVMASPHFIFIPTP